MSRKLPTPSAQSLPPEWKGFNLLNMFYFDDSQRDSKYKEIEFKMLSEWGFNFVRLPIDYRILMEQKESLPLKEPADWCKINDKAIKRLDEAVEFGTKYDIHVNINLHRAPGFTVATPAEPTDLWSQKEPQEAFAFLWAYFAERYKNIPNENLSFNLVNEPTDIKEAVYASVMKKAADAIWAIDSKRLLIADGLEYGRVPSAMIKDLGIAQSTRGYEPFIFTHYRASWVEGSDKYPFPSWPLNTEAEDEDVPGNKEKLRKICLKPWEDLKNSNCGVMVGEWGTHNRTPCAVVLKWMEDCLQNFKEAGLGWAIWGLTGSFGILNSGRKDVEYENCNGYKLDRKMLELLLKYSV